MHELLTSVQKLTTKGPLFKAGGSQIPAPQPGQVLQRSRNFAIVTSTFERNPNKEVEVVTSRTTSIISTDPEPNPPVSEPTGDEEGEDMDEINQEIEELFFDLQEKSPPQIHDPSPNHISTNTITPYHSPTPSPPLHHPESLIQPAAPEPPPTQPLAPTETASRPFESNQADAQPAVAVIQPAQLEIPSTTVSQQPYNPILTVTGTQVPKQAE